MVLIYFIMFVFLSILRWVHTLCQQGPVGIQETGWTNFHFTCGQASMVFAFYLLALDQSFNQLTLSLKLDLNSFFELINLKRTLAFDLIFDLIFRSNPNVPLINLTWVRINFLSFKLMTLVRNSIFL